MAVDGSINTSKEYFTVVYVFTCRDPTKVGAGTATPENSGRKVTGSGEG